MKTHAQFEKLLAHYDYLPPGERSELDAHLAACAECASAFAARRMAATQVQTPPSLELAPRAHPHEPAPQPPDPPPSSESSDERPPRAPFRWKRLLLPAALVLLFVASIAYGVSEPARRPTPPSRTPESPAFDGTPRPQSTPQPAATTIMFACDDVAAVYNDYARIARAFEEENPGIEIALKSYRDLLGNQSLDYVAYMQEVAASADAFCVWDVASLARQNMLYALDPLVEGDPEFEPSDFYEAVLETGRYQERLYAVPSRFQPALIRYDPEAFDQAGLPYPRPGWSWDDFLDSAVRLTQRDGGNTRRWGFADDGGVVFRARFAAALRDPAFLAAAASGDPFENATVQELARWFERLYISARPASPPRFLNEGAYAPSYIDARDIAQGRMAMWADLIYQNARRQGKPAPIPTDGQGGGAPVYMNASWAMAADTLHPDAAWLWLSYLSRNPPPDNAQLRLPARRSLVEKADFWQKLTPEEAEVYRYVLEHLDPGPEIVAATGNAQLLFTTFQEMVSKQRTLAQVLAARTPPPADAVPADIPVLTLAVPRDHISYYRTAAVAYMRATLNTNVEVIARESLSDPTRAEDTTIWQQMRQVANRADVIAGPGVAALARSGRAEGILLDLTSQVAALPPGRSFYANTVESLAWRDRVWAVPDRVFVYMIAYNGDIFDQMGAEQPRPGWTWEDFAQAAQAVTQPSADKMKWWGFSEGAGGTLPLLLSNTGPLVDYSVSPAAPLLDTPRVIEAARRYAKLWRQGFITVPDVRETARDMAAGRSAAMWVELVDPAALERLRSKGVSIASFPAVAGSDATSPIEIENAFAISAATDRPDAAWQLIDFLLRFRAPDAPPGAPALPVDALAVPWQNSDTVASYEHALNHAQRAAPLRREEYVAREALVDAIARLAMGERDAEQVMRGAQEVARERIGQ